MKLWCIVLDLGGDDHEYLIVRLTSKEIAKLQKRLVKEWKKDRIQRYFISQIDGTPTYEGLDAALDNVKDIIKRNK